METLSPASRRCLYLQIVSPGGTLFEGETLHATFPGVQGSFSVYPLHAPIMAALTRGVIVYYGKENGRQTVAIRNGWVEVMNDRVTVCVEAAT
jgi:F-type H+-transporting ATPase subunit epsilon